MSHDHMIMNGCSSITQDTLDLWFPDLHESAFFRDAMRLIRDQDEGKPITYESICKLFKRFIHPAKEPQAFDVVSKRPLLVVLTVNMCGSSLRSKMPFRNMPLRAHCL